VIDTVLTSTAGTLPQASSRRPRLSRLLQIPILLAALVCADTARAAECPPAAEQPPWPRLAGIDRIAGEALARVPMSGLSIAVLRDGKLVHAAGYGKASLELDVPATPQTVYRIGSVTKQFTAAAILRHAERGELKLEDDFRKYLPEYDTGGRAITIRQLLDHTSGIRNMTTIEPLMANRALDVTREQVFGSLSAAPFDFEPGERYLYNNSGYWLLGAIIEKLSGEPYDTAIERLLLEPLCLQSTRYDVPIEIVPNRASGYVRAAGGFRDAGPNSPTRPYASGALVSTVLDLVAWQRALFGGKVLSPASLRLMTTPGRLNDGRPTTFGLGVAVTQFRGHRRIAHPGGYVGYSSFLSYYPEEKIVIAVLTNTMGVELRPEVEERIASLLLPAAPKPAVAAQDPPRRSRE
jgi:CubicO group peptidase (beta-lactamase class C family)